MELQCLVCLDQYRRDLNELEFWFIGISNHFTDTLRHGHVPQKTSKMIGC